MHFFKLLLRIFDALFDCFDHQQDHQDESARERASGNDQEPAVFDVRKP